MGRVQYGEGGTIISGNSDLRCTQPQKRYATGLDAKVKVEVDSLAKVPNAEMDLQLSKTIIRLSDYTSEGLDLDLFLFRICEMANNRGFTREQTADLIKLAMDKWNTSDDIKKN